MFQKRKYISIIFLAIMLLLLIAPLYILLKIQMHQWITEGEMEKHHKIETLILSKEDFNRYKKDKHELNIDGKMFDIQSKEIVQNQYIIKGHFDNKEDKLLNDSENALHLQKFKVSLSFFSLFPFPINSIVDFSPTTKLVENHYTKYIEFFPTICYNKTCPPPWCSVA